MHELMISALMENKNNRRQQALFAGEAIERRYPQQRPRRLALRRWMAAGLIAVGQRIEPRQQKPIYCQSQGEMEWNT